MKYFPLVWAGLWRRRTRTIFTLLSIVVAFLLFGLLQGVNAWLKGAVDATQLSRLYVQSRISLLEPLPRTMIPQLESVPGVATVASFTWFGGYYQHPSNIVISYATEPDRIFAAIPEWKVAPEQIEALKRTRTGAIVGAQLARQYGWKVGDRVPIKTSIWTQKNGSNDWIFDVVGTYEVEGNLAASRIVLFNQEYFDEARAFGNETVSVFVLKVDDPTRSVEIAKQVDALFANSSNETRTQNEKEYAQAQLKQIGDIGFMVNAIVGAVFFTLLFLTGNTMMQSVRERIPELAVLKTVGFSDGAVTGLVLAEALLLCVFAALLGLGLAAAAFPIVAATSSVAGNAQLAGSVLLWGIVAAIAIALITAAPPVWRAHRLTIVDALAGR
jgi:putative ABC transport system permease protein